MAAKAAARINTTFEQRLVGGSDVAAILGCDPFKTAQEVWERFMGIGTGPKELTLDMERGNEQEAWALRRFGKVTGLKTQRVRQTLQGQPPWDHATAHLDSLIVNPARLPEGIELGGDVPDMEKLQGTGVIEVKNPRGPTWLKIKREGLKLKEDYLCQMVHYWGVTGWTWGAFMIFHSDYGHQIYFLERDEEMVQNVMSLTRDWYDRYVIGETAPPEPVAQELPGMDKIEGTDLVFDSSPLWRELVVQFRDATEGLKEAKALDVAMRQLVKDYMLKKDDAQAIQGGGGLVYHRPQEGKETFDRVKLAAYGALDPALVRAILIQILPKDKHAQLERWISECKLDMDLFKGRGKPSRPLKPYFSKLD